MGIGDWMLRRRVRATLSRNAAQPVGWEEWLMRDPAKLLRTEQPGWLVHLAHARGVRATPMMIATLRAAEPWIAQVDEREADLLRSWDGPDVGFVMPEARVQRMKLAVRLEREAPQLALLALTTIHAGEGNRDLVFQGCGTVLAILAAQLPEQAPAMADAVRVVFESS